MNSLAQKTTRRYKRLAVVFLFLVLPVLAFPELIFDHQTLYLTDLSWMHFPRHIFAAAEWQAGRIPLWDPFENTGIPLLAESQVGALYPLSILFLSPLPPALELSWFVLVHFTLAGLFTFILARLLGLSRPAAAVSGLGFGMGGFLMAQVPNLNIMTGAVWLPLILWAVIRAGREQSWRAALSAGIPLAMQIFTAQPQIVFYTLVIIAGYGVYKMAAGFISTPRRRASRPVLLAAAAMGCGLLLAAPQLLPTLELQQLSIRAAERDFGFLTANSLPPAQWLNLLIPGAFGNNVVGFKGGDPFQEDFIYLGFIPLVLVWPGIVSVWTNRQHPHRQERLFFLILLVIAALLAMGRFTPLYRLVVQYLPGFALFRVPARWLVAVNLSLAVLAGAGLDRLLARRPARRTLVTMLAVGLVLLAGLLLIRLFQADLLLWSNRLDDSSLKLVAAFLTKSFQLHPLYRERWLLGQIPLLCIPAVLLATNIIIFGLLLALYSLRKLSPSAFALLIVLAVSVDLTIAGGTTINPTKPADWWWQLSGGARFVLNNTGPARVFPLGMGSEELAVSHLGQYFPSVYRVQSAGGHGSSLMLERYTTFLHQAHPVQAIRLTGVRYVLAVGHMGADVASTFPIAYGDDNSVVYENKDPLPRAFIVHRAVLAGSPEEALSYFQSLNLDPRQAVVLEWEGAPPPSLPADPPASGSAAKITGQHPQQVQITTSAAADGYLVLLDTYYPGWQATIDGRPTPIYRANYIGRAVFVPAGQHTVRFVYRPRSFWLGAGLSLLAVVGLAATRLRRVPATSR